MLSLAAEWGELPHAPRVKQLRVATPKGGRTREVPPSNEAIAALKARRHLKGEYAFCETDGRRLTHSRVKSVVPSTCKKAGLAKRLTTHDLRHTFASHLVMRGGELKAVQELLGHESIEMVMRHALLAGGEAGRGEAPGTAGEDSQRLPDGTRGRTRVLPQKNAPTNLGFVGAVTGAGRGI